MESTRTNADTYEPTPAPIRVCVCGKGKKAKRIEIGSSIPETQRKRVNASTAHSFAHSQTLYKM